MSNENHAKFSFPKNKKLVKIILVSPVNWVFDNIIMIHNDMVHEIYVFYDKFHPFLWYKYDISKKTISYSVKYLFSLEIVKQSYM